MNTRTIGDIGEKAACEYLKKNKYKILDCNYRKTYGEIDIIAKKGETVSFIEVKTRKNNNYGLPCEYVTKAKQQKLINTAYTYIEEKQLDDNYSFDIIEVYHENGKVNKINHIKNAFSVE
ncbi:MAG: YraN family protein [Clostridia bacterium]|nr:YraN family protein [Clostridia bacterium]